MSIPLTQVIDEIRQTANVQNTLFLSDDPEMARIANQAISSTYDFIVECYAPYFATQSPFSLTSSNVIELSQIVNPTQLPRSPDVTSNTEFYPHNVLTFFPPIFATLSGLPSSYQVTSFSVTKLNILTSGGCTVEIYVNGLRTGCAVVLSNSSPVSGTNTSVNPVFSVLDTVAIGVTTQANNSISADMGVTVSITLTQVLNNAPFYKELGLDWLGQSRPISVPRLESFMARNYGNGLSDGLGSGLGRNYDIIGSQLQMFPPNGNFSGNYMLHYVPSAPVLDDVTDLPTEMERWRTLINLEGAIMVKLKRNMEVTDLERRLAIKKKEIETAMRKRVKEPKPIPMRTIPTGGRWNGGFGGGWGF